MKEVIEILVMIIVATLPEEVKLAFYKNQSRSRYAAGIILGIISCGFLICSYLATFPMVLNYDPYLLFSVPPLLFGIAIAYIYRSMDAFR